MSISIIFNGKKVGRFYILRLIKSMKLIDYLNNINTTLSEFPIPWLQVVIVALMGIVFGSFLNVLIYRIPKGEEFVKTSSHCMKCGHKLAWYDNIPLFSWLTLGGKCRYCKEKISAQYPIIEATNGILWVAIVLLLGLSIHSIALCFITSGLLALSVIDWRTYEIANGFHVYIGVFAAINLLFDYPNWLSYVIGFFAVSLLLLAIYLVSGGRAIGGGDVKLMAACGLFLGWKNVLLSLAIGCIVGSIVHILRMKLSGANKVLAMGPYLSIGVLVSALFGNQIIAWYIGLLG